MVVLFLSVISKLSNSLASPVLHTRPNMCCGFGFHTSHEHSFPLLWRHGLCGCVWFLRWNKDYISGAVVTEFHSIVAIRAVVYVCHGYLALVIVILSSPRSSAVSTSVKTNGVLESSCNSCKRVSQSSTRGSFRTATSLR